MRPKIYVINNGWDGWTFFALAAVKIREVGFPKLLGVLRKNG